ncbi:hypothetical protein AB0J83_26820, partial [Actinoplanes sp. NPDC049596]
MTSEGHYAGSRPAEATSGGPTSDGFPPDTDGQRAAGRVSAQPPADGFPSSYGPPPQATPNGGSPFVVPAVSSFGPSSGGPASGGQYGSARVPQPDEGGALPQRGSASPYGSVSAGEPYAASAPSPSPEQPSSAWAPQVRSTPDSENQFVQRQGAPLPQRNANPGGTVDDLQGFNGFAAGQANRGPESAAPASSASYDGPAFSGDPAGGPAASGGPSADDFGRGSGFPGEQADQSTGRPPGISAFDNQRVRVPGATLTDLPDAPPSVRPTGAPAPAAADPAGGFPLRGAGGGGSAFPTRGGGSGGFPLRGTPGASEPEAPAAVPQQPSQPGELPVRTQQPTYGAPASSPDGQPSGGFSSFGGGASSSAPAAEEIPPHPYRSEPFADPFGRSESNGPAPELPSRNSGGPGSSLPDPFGRNAQEEQSASGSAYGSAKPSAPFGAPAEGSSDAAFGSSPASPVYGSARPAEGSATPYGSARPAFGDSPEENSGAQPATGTYGSARPFSSANSEESPYGAPASGSPYGAPRSASEAPAYGSGFGESSRDEAPDDHAQYRRPEPAGDNGYPQRVPGAALGALTGSDSRNGSVPQPRDPSEVPPAAGGSASVSPATPAGPVSGSAAAGSASTGSASAGSASAGPAAVGSARPVTASASVPTNSRVAPVEATELPPPPAAPQARVYGRAAPTEPDQGEASSAPEYQPAADFSEPTGMFTAGARPGEQDEPSTPGVAPQSPARASARVSPAGAAPVAFPTGAPAAPPETAPGGSTYGAPAGGSPFGATPDQPASGSPYGTPASGSPFGATPDQPASGS